MWLHRLHHWQHLADGHAQQHEVGSGERIGPVGCDNIDDPLRQRRLQRRTGASHPDQLFDQAGLAQGERERAADQPHPADDDALEHSSVSL